MVDADDPAIGRVDEVTDPTALTEREIRQQLENNPNLEGAAVREFASQIAEKRQGVAQEAESMLRNRIAPNPANPETIQLRKADGTLGPKVPEEGAGAVDLEMNDRGQVTATIDGESVDLGRVDLNKGASHEGVGSYQRSLDTYSTRKHPAQKAGGGR